MTLGFSESVQCVFLRSMGEGGGLLQFFIKMRRTAPSLSQGHKHLIIEAFKSTCDHPYWRAGSKLIV